MDAVTPGMDVLLAAEAGRDAPPGTRKAMEVDVPVLEEVSENFLEIHEVKTGKFVTIVELLSPANKLHRQGREEYRRKRSDVCPTPRR